MASISPLSLEKTEQIEDMLSQRPGYVIVQINGQRFYRREDDVREDTKRGIEVFIGALPRDCYEDELVPVFEKIGTIRRLRLMMDFSGTNRGYAYVEYDHPEDARVAAEDLDGYELRTNRRIGVALSYDKRRLFIGGIPRNKKKKDVLKEMKKVTEGVKDVIIYMSVYNHKNRGFCFVEYETHRDAAMARRRMGEGFILWGKHEVRVDWADPEPDVDEETMKKVKIIHVRNLPLSVTEADLKEIFSFEDLHIERVKKIRDFAFIHFATREETERALSQTNVIEFRNKYSNLRRIQVSLARPQKTKSLRRRTDSTATTATDLSNSFSKVGSNPISHHLNQMTQLLPSAQTQVDTQLRYYQNMFEQQLIPQQMTQPKYETITDKNDLNFFVVWVPVVWLPHSHNKDLSIDDNTFFCSNI